MPGSISPWPAERGFAEGRRAMAEPVLRKGSNDPAVRDLQEALKALGHYAGPVDGVFGAATEGPSRRSSSKERSRSMGSSAR
jgi:peptidoglycan hydrolase-like protein with peptidoglycan-binding domain